MPNTLDSEWQIDIKKSTATPPLSCREQLRSYALDVRNKGMEVYRHRGKILKKKAGENFQPLWLEKKKGNKWSFVVNRENQLIKDLQEEAKINPVPAINKLLRIIEESIPTPTIYVKQSSEEELQKEPFRTWTYLLLRTCYLACMIIKSHLVNHQSRQKQSLKLLSHLTIMKN